MYAARTAYGVSRRNPADRGPPVVGRTRQPQRERETRQGARSARFLVPGLFCRKVRNVFGVVVISK